MVNSVQNNPLLPSDQAQVDTPGSLFQPKPSNKVQAQTTVDRIVSSKSGSTAQAAAFDAYYQGLNTRSYQEMPGFREDVNRDLVAKHDYTPDIKAALDKVDANYNALHEAAASGASAETQLNQAPIKPRGAVTTLLHGPPSGPTAEQAVANTAAALVGKSLDPSAKGSDLAHLWAQGYEQFRGAQLQNAKYNWWQGFTSGAQGGGPTPLLNQDISIDAFNKQLQAQLGPQAALLTQNQRDIISAAIDQADGATNTANYASNYPAQNSLIASQNIAQGAFDLLSAAVPEVGAEQAAQGGKHVSPVFFTTQIINNHLPCEIPTPFSLADTDTDADAQ